MRMQCFCTVPLISPNSSNLFTGLCKALMCPEEHFGTQCLIYLHTWTEEATQ